MPKKENLLLRSLAVGIAVLALAGCSLFNIGSIGGIVTTLAGDAGYSGSTNSTGTSATFNFPKGIATDGSILYVADTSNHLIRRIVASTGAVTTVAGTGIYGSTNGTSTSASFNSPTGITYDGTNLYVADTGNHTIRQIVVSTGAVTTLAGTAGSAGTTNATGSAARFSSPAGITTDGRGNLFVADTGNHTIRQIVISTAVVTTLAGAAGSALSTDATGTSARFSSPAGITTDGINLYVADTGNNTVRQIVISTGVVTTLAGTASSYGGSFDGAGTSASFSSPRGIDADGKGDLYVADTSNHAIRKIVISTKVVTTLAGTAGSYNNGSNDGTGTSAEFNNPSGIIFDGTSLFVADTNNHAIRQIK